MAVDTAKSTSTTVAQAYKNRYYDELFLQRAEAMLQHKQVGQRNKNIPKGEGGYGTGSVYWTRWSNLPVITAGQGEGVPTTAISLTATNVTGTTAQYDNAVSVSDILAYVSFGDVMKSAIEILAYNAGLSIDTVVRNAVSLSGTFQGAGSITSLAAITAMPSTATYTITEVRRANRTLQRNNAMPFEGGWVAIIHPDVLYDLQADTTTGGWIDSSKYTDAYADGLKTGEVGRLMGVRFLESSNAKVQSTTSITGSGSVYVTNVFGKEAFGVTDLQNLQTFVKGFSSGGTGDPTEKVATAGWKTTFGAASLNSSFYVNSNTMVSSTA